MKKFKGSPQPEKDGKVGPSSKVSRLQIIAEAQASLTRRLNCSPPVPSAMEAQVPRPPPNPNSDLPALDSPRLPRVFCSALLRRASATRRHPGQLRRANRVRGKVLARMCATELTCIRPVPSLVRRKKRGGGAWGGQVHGAGSVVRKRVGSKTFLLSSLSYVQCPYGWRSRAHLAPSERGGRSAELGLEQSYRTFRSKVDCQSDLKVESGHSGSSSIDR